jgi:hypothetical protein
MRAFAADEDPNAGGPAGEPVPARAAAQQPGELGHVCFVALAPRMRAAPVRAGVISAAFPDLAAVIDGDLPGVLRGQPDRVPLAPAQIPADRVDQLVPGPGGGLVQAGDQPVACPGPIGGDHQPPPVPGGQGGDRVIERLQVIGDGVRPRAARAQHPGQRLGRVVTVGQQR